MKLLVKVLKLGRMRYVPALKIQKYFEARHLQDSTQDHVLLLVEHDPVYTLGLRQIISPQEKDRLEKTGADVVHADRGGLTTFHGPGQLVAYPIFNLDRYDGMTLRKYVSLLEIAAVHTCRMLGVNAELDTTNVSHTGAWANNNKICAIGVHQKQRITTHGLALNCDVDLKWFRNIVPCGIVDKGVTSLSAELGETLTVEDVIPQFLVSFESIFKCELEDYDKEIVEKVIASDQMEQ